VDETKYISKIIDARLYVAILNYLTWSEEFEFL
jgi:hypothetical protein